MAEPNNSANKPDPTVQFLGEMAMATMFWAVTFIVTKTDWFARATGLPARVALVAIGIGGFLPIVFVYAKSIRMQDEFNQRVHLIALAVAFAAMAAISYSVDLLHQAHFMPQPLSGGVWALMVAVWFVALIITPRFYR
jgi:hypothetical protein